MADGDSSDTLQGDDDVQLSGATSARGDVGGSDKPIKENTGRWTQEEHRLFLKGLELHGKGWKKIASLIKTRTVVQIRTHAQKYFLKLQKAQQNGEAAGPIMMDGKSLSTHTARKKNSGRRRTSDKPPAIAEVLKPYVEAEDGGHVEQHIYRFLSAPLDDSGHGTSPVSVTDSGSASGDHSSTTVAVGSKRSHRGVESEHEQAVSIPEWFQTRGELNSLLEKAEHLDWTADPGPTAVVPISSNAVIVGAVSGSMEVDKHVADEMVVVGDEANHAAHMKENPWLNTDASEAYEFLQYVVDDDQESPESDDVSLVRRIVNLIDAGDPAQVGDTPGRKRQRLSHVVSDGHSSLHYVLTAGPNYPAHDVAHDVSESDALDLHEDMIQALSPHACIPGGAQIELYEGGDTHNHVRPGLVEVASHEPHGSDEHDMDTFSMGNDIFDDESFSLEAMLANET